MQRCGSGFVALVLASCVQAQDRMLPTAPPERLTSLSGVSAHQDFPETGRVTLSFANGDQILVDDATCKLAPDARCLLNPAELPSADKINAFLAALLQGPPC